MLHKLFPTQVYHSSIPYLKLLKELQIEAYQIETSDHEGKSWSQKNYKNGFTSYGSMDRLHLFSSTFADLKKKIDAHVKKYSEQLQLDISAGELSMSTCWLNIMPANTTHSMHIHPLSVISGTFYVQIPTGTSPLKFEDPRMVNFMASPPRKPKAEQDNKRFFEIKPKSGDLVLFESWLRHEVPAHTSKKDRISISFNYDWTAG